MSRNDLLDEDGENRALRSFLMQYGSTGLTVAAMAQHMRRSGWESEYWPDFARRVDNAGQHLTKGGAQVWIRHLLAMEPVAARELDVEAERREFEDTLTVMSRARKSNGEYAFPVVEGRWQGWLDRAARSAAQGTQPEPVDESLTADEIEALRSALNWMGESTYETLEECGIYQRNLVRRLIHAVVANRDATFAAQSTQPESAPVSTEQAGDAQKEEKAARDAFRLAWECTLSYVAFYVAGHCVDGDHHAEIIMGMTMPKMTFRGAAPSPNHSPVGGKGEQ